METNSSMHNKYSKFLILVSSVLLSLYDLARSFCSAVNLVLLY